MLEKESYDTLKVLPPIDRPYSKVSTCLACAGRQKFLQMQIVNSAAKSELSEVFAKLQNEIALLSEILTHVEHRAASIVHPPSPDGQVRCPPAKMHSCTNQPGDTNFLIEPAPEQPTPSPFQCDTGAAGRCAEGV